MKLDKLESSSLGRLGGAVVSGTGVNTGKYGAVQFIIAGTLTTLTGGLTGTATGITYPAGFVIYGYFTVVTLASGSAILYNAE